MSYFSFLTVLVLDEPRLHSRPVEMRLKEPREFDDSGLFTRRGCLLAAHNTPSTHPPPTPKYSISQSQMSQMSVLKLINILPQRTSNPLRPYSANHCSLCQTFIHLYLPSPNTSLINSPPPFIYPIPLWFTPIYHLYKSNLHLSSQSPQSDIQRWVLCCRQSLAAPRRPCPTLICMHMQIDAHMTAHSDGSIKRTRLL